MAATKSKTPPAAQPNTVLIDESALPQDLPIEQAVEAAYCTELANVASLLQRSLPVLVECDKELSPYLYQNLRNRLRSVQPPFRCLYLDGRPRQDDQQGQGGGMMPQGMMGTMIAQLREAVRGGTVERRVVVLPHLDLLTTSAGGLTAEAREVIPLLYENPDLVWLGFKDPSFPLPRVIEQLFPHRVSLLGLNRTRLRHLITQRESRKFGRQFNPWQLYKHVSGVNAIRLRKLLSTLEGEDYPANAAGVLRQLRQGTLGGTLEMPNISFDRDIGGYAKVKDQLRNEILNLIARKEELTSEESIRAIEELIPKGMIFWGPPGTGKTLFAKAMASEIGAAITVVSGPELKSKWVGESLPYEEELFVVLNGVAQRIAIGDLVEKHDQDEVLTWTVRDDGTALLAPVTGFIRHKGPDYIDVLVTETGREVRVTGGHSLFVEKDGRLAEVFAEEVEVGTTRIAVPLRLEAPQTLTEVDAFEIIEGAGATQEVNRGACGVAITEVKTTRRRSPEAEVLIAYGQARRLGGSAFYLPLNEDLGEFAGQWTAAAAARRVPSFVFLAPLPCVDAFLRGYFGGEFAEAAVPTRELANDLLTLLQYRGVLASCHASPEGAGYVLKKTPAGHITNDVLWDRVVEKRREPYSHPHVYDISVPETERFIAGFGNVLVHNSEENLRQIFHRARQSAPAIIVFDEIDSFATARGTYTGSGVEHSMVNQLLTEMDGFHKEEMVFVIGTTNFVESLDPALLRPGRFEFHLHIPYPDGDARREIFKIYDQKMKLQLTEEALDYAVRRTGRGYITAQGTAFSGDHINAIARSVARIRLREQRTDATKPEDIERGLTEYDEKLDLTRKEEWVAATHEAGHAIVALFTESSLPIERITIKSEMPWAPAYVSFKPDETRRIVQTFKQMFADLAVTLGGIEAERLMLDDISTGASGSDLVHATRLAEFMVEFCGMGGGDLGLRQFRDLRTGERLSELSEDLLARIDKEVHRFIHDAQAHAAKVLRENRDVLVLLRDMLLEKKTIEAKALRQALPDAPGLNRDEEEAKKTD